MLGSCRRGRQIDGQIRASEEERIANNERYSNISDTYTSLLGLDQIIVFFDSQIYDTEEQYLEDMNTLSRRNTIPITRNLNNNNMYR